MDYASALQDSLDWKKLSWAERIELAKWLLKEKSQAILMREILMAREWVKNYIDITLKARDCTDQDEDIRKFLSVLGCYDISVSSDFPAYCESYEGSTRIKFRV